MAITLTYTFANAEELAAHLNGAGRHTAPAVQPEAPATKKPDAQHASPPSGVKPPPAATEPVQDAPATSPASDEGKAAYTVDDAKELTKRLVADKGRDTAVSLLQKYSVPVAAKLPADKVEAFCREAKEMLK